MSIRDEYIEPGRKILDRLVWLEVVVEKLKALIRLESCIPLVLSVLVIALVLSAVLAPQFPYFDKIFNVIMGIIVVTGIVIAALAACSVIKLYVVSAIEQTRRKLPEVNLLVAYLLAEHEVTEPKLYTICTEKLKKVADGGFLSQLTELLFQSELMAGFEEEATELNIKSIQIEPGYVFHIHITDNECGDWSTIEDKKLAWAD